MRVLFLGDVVGRSGRKAVLDNLPQLKLNLRPDFIIVNGENAAGGFGITPSICDELFNAGIDVIRLHSGRSLNDIVSNVEKISSYSKNRNF